MTENEKTALKNFLLDINCLNVLDKWADDFNLFDVLRITNMEIRHSNILAWLFDPNESHRIGDSFIKEFSRKLAEKINRENFDYFAFMLQDFYSYQVFREASHMDIVLYSREEKNAIIIENKIWSGESKHQLQEYYKKSLIEYNDCSEILYVFLTPDGSDSSDPEHWLPFSYEEIIEALEYAVADTELRPEVSLLLKNYITTVRKNIMHERDEELVRICTDIYNKHRTALRLIFENVSIDNSIESEVICSTLQELSNEGLIFYEGNNNRNFSTPKMDAFLPPLSTPNSSWKTKYIYSYWLDKPDDDHLAIHFELGGDNLNKEQSYHSKLLIQAAGNKKKTEYQYRRLFHQKVKISQNDYETSLRNAVKKLVKSALENEKKLLDKVGEILNSQ